MVAKKIWEKIITLKKGLTDNEMINFALQYRNIEKCSITSHDSINDPGERNDIEISKPRKGEEDRASDILNDLYTYDAYGLIFLKNTVGYAILYPKKVIIGANSDLNPQKDRDVPPEELVQTVLKLLPSNNIESIKVYKNY